MQKSNLKHFVVAIFMICAISVHASASADFTSSWTSIETNESTCSAWGDYDGDGDLDVVVGDANTGTMLYSNAGGASFSIVWQSEDADLVVSLAWGDYDRDGDLDILVGNNPGNNRVYSNSGGGVFTLAWTSSSVRRTVRAEWGDADADGDLDFLAGVYDEPARAFRNTGASQFELIWSSQESDPTTCIDWADADADGDLDFVKSANSAVDRVYRNEGGSAYTLMWSSARSDKAYFTEWSDYDGDGDLDFAVANYDEKDRVYKNSGNWYFDMVWASATDSPSIGLAWGDYDGDGDSDLLFGNYAASNNVVAYAGSDNFTDSWSSPEADYTYQVTWADYDGDGDLDHFVSNISSQSNRLYKNNLSISNSPPAAPVITGQPDGLPGLITLSWSAASDDITPAVDLTYQVRVGTCSGCGGIISGAFAPPFGNSRQTEFHKLNIQDDGTYYWSVAAVDSAGFSTSTWYVEDSFTISAPSGTPYQSIWTGPSSDQTTAIATADYDDDGDLDFIAANDSEVNTVYRYNGNNTFTAVWSSPETDATNDAAWADYDGDGDLDHAVADNGANRVYSKTDDYNFSLVWSSTETSNSLATAWGDYDRDGDLDLFAGNVGANHLYRNNSDDTFTLVWTSTETDTTSGAVWLDADADGVPDIFCASDGTSDRLYLNNGDDTFTLAWSSTQTDATKDAAAADYDGDGLVDISAPAVGATQNRLYSNNGDGTFTLAWSSTQTDETYSCTWGDYDGDGDWDLLAGNSGVNRVYAGDGAGGFTLEWSSAEGEVTYAAAWGDVDGDGDLDIISGNNTSANRLYLYTSDISNLNPAAPVLVAGSNATLSGATVSVTFNWNAAVDDTTAPVSMMYHLRAGTCSGCDDIVSGAYASPVPNVGATTSISIVFDATGTYYWSVAAIDNTSLSASSWSSEDSFEIIEPTGTQTPFESIWTGTDINLTRDAAWGDYDGDGDLDFFAANYTQGNFVYRNDGSATFNKVYEDNLFSYTTSGAWGDYDGDGDLDLLFSNYNESNYVFKNTGSDDFVSAWSTTQANSTNDAEWGDMDGDGDLDFIAGNDGQSILVFSNNGSGGFTYGWGSTETNNTSSISVVDFDKDGDLDFIAVNNGQSDIIYDNGGGGTFSVAWTSAETDSGSGGAWGDYDGDGDYDIAVANNTQSNRVYSNAGAANFTSVWTSTEADASHTAAWGDYDGDGDLDLLFGNYYTTSDTDRVYTNAGGDNFPLGWSATNQEYTRAAAWGDYDGDGDLDFIAANEDGSDRIYRNNLSISNTAPPAPTLTLIDDGDPGTVVFQWAATSDDITPDSLLAFQLRVGTCTGCDDIISGEFAPPFVNMGATGSYPMILGNGDYYWSIASVDTTGFSVSSWSTEDDFHLEHIPAVPFESTWQSTESNRTAALALGDFDGDSDLDHIAADSDSIRLYRNTGSYSFTLAWSSSSMTNNMDAAWGDYDGDGDLDFAVSTGSGGYVSVYEQTTYAAFSSVWASSQTDKTYSVAWADCDADGDLDLLTANLADGSTGSNNRVYRNEGRGDFVVNWTSAEADITYDAAWGDYDGDGYRDIVAGNDGANRIYRNVACDYFTIVWTSVESDRTTGVAWMDYDGDGDLDFAAGSADGNDRVYNNDGAGGFSAVWTSTATSTTSSVAWGDYNADGYPDLASVNNSSIADSEHVYGNNGDDTFSTAWNSPLDEESQDVAWGDIDGDGDLDLLIASGGDTSADANILYVNYVEPANNAPTTPSVTVVPDGFTGYVDLQWTASTDDVTPSDEIRYIVRAGTCSGCNDIISGLYSPPLTNAGTATSYRVHIAGADTYYWQVKAIDMAGFRESGWSNADDFVLTDRFSSAWTGSAYYNIEDVAWGDYDGDGDLDIAAAVNGTPNLVIENSGGGSFSTVWSSSESDYTRSAAWGDADNDGDLDILVGNTDSASGGDQNRVYSNNGDGTFTVTWSTFEMNRTYDAVFTDCDADGDLDIVAANEYENIIYTNNGGSSFTSSSLSSHQERTRALSPADFDADGDFDLLEGNYGAPNRVFRNDGSGNFSELWASSGSEYTSAVAWADTDGDGDLDAFFGNSYVGALNYINVNDGAGSFSASWTSRDADETYDAAFGDTDGDGDLDLITANSDSDSTRDNYRLIRVYSNSGGNLFAASANMGAGDYAVAVALGDYDGDGDLDILEGSSDGGDDMPVRVYMNNMDPSNAAPSAPSVIKTDNQVLSAATSPISIAWSAPSDDITVTALLSYQLRIGTCPGCSDVMSGAFAPPGGNIGATTAVNINMSDSGTYYWSVAAVDNTGFATGAWSDEEFFAVSLPLFDTGWTSPEGGTCRDAAAGDFDGDGDLDIASSFDAQNMVYENNGSGSFSDAWTSAESENTMEVAWGDYDNDGDPDILVASANGPARIYKNTGGTFSTAWSSIMSVQGGGVSWADLDNDGDLDFAASSYGINNLVYRNDGGDSFTLSWLSSDTDNTTDVECADFDNDGDSDIAAANESGPVKLYANDGAGSFIAVWTSSDTGYTSGISTGDYDGDGNLDMLTVAGSSYYNRVYRGGGGGTFTAVWTAGEDGPFSGGAWGDYDADGDLDFFVSYSGTDSRGSHVYRNTGSDSFNLVWASLNDDASYSAAFGDFDGDGNIDLLSANTGVRTWTNMSTVSNSAPAQPTVTAVGDQEFHISATPAVTLSWTAPSDDYTPSNSLTYQVRVGTCSGCSDIVSDTFVPPWGNAGPSTSYTFNATASGTYYWSVSAVDTSGFLVGASSAEDVFDVSFSMLGTRTPFDYSWYGSASDYSSGSAWGDYDADGDLDILISDAGASAGNRIYSNDGGNTFTLAWTATEWNTTEAAAWADYDGDGDLDAVFVSGGSGEPNYVYRNVGAGGFVVGWTSTETEPSQAVAIGDFDGDGDLDIFVGNNSASVPDRVYKNVSTGFTTAWTSSSYYTTRAVDMADYNLDGRPDLLLGNSGSAMEPIVIYSNKGGECFTEAWTSSEQEYTSAVEWGDYDGDGDLDIAAGNWMGDETIRIYANISGNYSSVWTRSSVDRTVDVAWGDYDGDGDLDLLAGNAEVNYKYNRIFTNDGGDSFSLYWSSAEDESTGDVDWADYDNDGDLDFFAANNGIDRVYTNNDNPSNTPPSAPVVNAVPDGYTGRISFSWSAASDDITGGSALNYQVRIGTCSACDDIMPGEFSPPRTNAGATTSITLGIAETGTYYWSVAAVDATGFSVSSWSAEDTFTLTEPSGTFSTFWLDMTSDETRGVAWGDYDGDGYLDFAAGNYGQPNRIFRNSGGTAFVFTWKTTEADNTTGVAWGDYNGDGYLDLLAPSYNSKNRVYRYDGGDFTLAWSSDNSDTTTDALWGDSDNDGDLDIFVADKGQALRVLNNSNGSFSSVWTSLQAYNTNSIDCGDFDGDGDLDIIAGIGGSASNRIYENSGSNLFVLVWSSAQTYSTEYVLWGDYDGDGDLDIFSANTGGSDPNVIYSNYGLRTFVQTWASAEMETSQAAAHGDYDGDGDFDIVVGNTDETSNRVYSNDGSGSFTLQWTSPHTEDTYSIAFGDLDNDGDIDMLAGGDTLRVYENNTDPANTAPVASDLTAVSDAEIQGDSLDVAFLWSDAGDDLTAAPLLSYQLRIGTCSGCDDIVSGTFVPPSGNITATQTFITFSTAGDYYWSVRAVDSTGFSAGSWSSEDTFTLTFGAQQTTTLTSGWNLMTFPGDIASSTISSSLSTYSDVGDTFGFSGGKLIEGTSVNVELASGYWVYAENSVEITLGGASATPDSQTVTVSPLDNGWNLVGNPYVKYLKWADNITIDCGSGDTVLSGAVTAGYTDGNIYEYSGSGYEKISSGDYIKPWNAFFIRIEQTCCSMKLTLD